MEPPDRQTGGKRKSRATRRGGGQRENTRAGGKKRTQRRRGDQRNNSRAGRKNRRK